jgi:3-phenylpropionate/trans-cinnamate dioxygenase ferredoxin reductase component
VNAPDSKHILILGAGHAGGVAAAALIQAGFAGQVTLLGQETHPPYERPPLSKEVLAGIAPFEKTYLRPLAFYADAGIKLRRGETAVAIDRQAQRVKLASGETVPYDALLLTLGARARRLPVPGGGHGRVFYLRDIADSLALRARFEVSKHITVIGAGFIGLEAAAVARKRGLAVTVLEMQREPIQRVAAPEIGHFLANLHRGNGVDLRTGIGVNAIEETGGELRLALSTGERSTGESLATDNVLVGIGALPNTELAAEAGLAVEDGVVVDEFGRTSDPAIYAAGDVTRHWNPLLKRRIRLEAWQNAQNQAIAVAKVMAGGHEPFAEIPWFWTDQYDVNLQMAGSPESWDSLVWRGTTMEKSFTVFYLKDGKPVACNTVNNGRDMRFARELVAKGRTIDPVRLADKTVKLQDLVREN